MKKAVKISLILATILVVLGLGMFVTVLAVNEFDINKVSGEMTETKEVALTESFNNIDIDVETANIIFIKTDLPEGKVVCQERKRVKYHVSIDEDTLKITVDDNRRWYHYVGLRFERDDMKVYLPQATYNSLILKSATGNIEIPKEFNFTSVNLTSATGYLKMEASTNILNVKFNTGGAKLKDMNLDSLDINNATGKIELENVNVTDHVELKSNTGSITLTNVNAKSLNLSVDTGKVLLDNVILQNRLRVKSSTGTVTLVGIDAGEIYITTSTGTVTGTILTPKIFRAKSDTGRVTVPHTTTGGICEIETDTGTINIKIATP